jgi:serine/threonine protein kinase
MFGKYELLDRIAAGGMAEIFKARYSPAPGVTKQVVIKKILPHYAENKAFIGMFTNEARIAIGLSHGNIAQVFDFGAIDGDYFLAMEFVDGQPLSKVLKRARTLGIPALPEQLATFVVAETLKGLHYAHTRLDEQGRALHIVHRDVSPQNVLVSYEAQIKVVDFGIARARNAGVEETNSSALKGKYTYFSPEQARSKDLDARTDVFAAGIVLYEALTGQLPFPGKMMDSLNKLVRGQFPRPREVNRRISVELERIILKALALERGDRYATAEAFAQDLSRHLAQAHPDFQPALLGQFMQLLFEEDLVKAGRPVQLPPAFLEQAQGWKKALPKEDDEEAPTEMMSLDDAEPTDKQVKRPLFPTVPLFNDARRDKLPVFRALALTAAAIAVGFLAVVVALRFRHGGLEVDSVPPGAQVTLDGQAVAGVTPLVIEKLDGNRTFHLELTLPGYARWKNDVPLRPGQRLLVSAALAAEAPPPAPPPVKPVEPLVETPAPPPVPDTVTWPTKALTLDIARHHLDLSTAGATKVKLDPALTYRVSLSRGPTPGWGFYVVNDSGAMPVAFADQPLEMKGASSLFAFHLPLGALGAHGPEEKKPRQLTVQSPGQRKPAQYPVSPKLEVAEPSHVTLTGLSAGSAYELTPRHGVPAARLREGAPPLSRLVIATRAGLQIIPFDEVTRVEGVEAVLFTVIEDASRPLGRVEVEVREVPRQRRRR